MDTDAEKRELEKETELELLREELQKGIDDLEAGRVSKLTMEDIGWLARAQVLKKNF